MEYIWLTLLGFLAGAIGSLVGLGGGVIIVPALLFLGTTGVFPDISPQLAVGTSLVVIIFNGLSSTLSYMKHKTVDYKSGFLFFLGSGPGATVGALVNNLLNIMHFSLYFGLFLIFSSFLLMLQGRWAGERKNSHFKVTRTYITNEGEMMTYGYHPVVAIIIAFIVGFFSGLFGIGGGSLMVPVMILLFFFPPHVAVATTMFIILLSSLISSSTHIILGNVEWLFALALIPGVWFGAKMGAYINRKLQSKTIVALLRIVLIFLGVRLIYQGIA